MGFLGSESSGWRSPGDGQVECLGMIKLFCILIAVLVTCCVYVFLDSSDCTQNRNILLYVNYVSNELIWGFFKYLQFKEFPGSLVRTQHFNCWGPRFSP